jgi:hypothetical protein
MSFTILVAIVAFAGFGAVVFVLRSVLGRERRALVALASTFACKRCGEALGEAGVSLADELWERHVQRVLSGSKGTPRIVRNLDAACPKCGQRYQHDPDAKTFKPIEIALAFE